MKNVLILGASGNIAQHVTDLLAHEADLRLTLFVRSARRLRSPPANARVVYRVAGAIRAAKSGH